MALTIKETEVEEYAAEIEKTMKSGKIAVYPTETCYGIGCIISSRASVDRIFHLKKRPRSNPLPVIAASLEMMDKYAVVTSAAEKLFNAFMPGPLTLLLDRRRTVPEWFPGEKIGIRVPGNETARKLCKLAGEPLISTSANISGERQFYEIKQVMKTFERKIGLIIDAGDLPYNTPSTIYDVEHKRILRKGKIPVKEIEEALSK